MSRIDAKQAAQAAAKYLSDMRDLIDAKLRDVRLEEIELLEAPKVWVVTLGYDVPSQASNDLFPAILNPRPLPGQVVYKRDYKTFQVNSETGEVESMKIRSIN
jgi:hypothetical protein